MLKDKPSLPQYPRQEELQLSVSDSLDSIDDAMLLAHPQCRRRREGSYQQIHEAARTEPDPRHNS